MTHARENERRHETASEGDVPKEAERPRDHVLSALAHELRNPLVPLRAGLSLIRLAGRDAEAIAEHCAIMERQLDKLIGIVDDLCDVTSLAEGRLRLEKTRVDVETLVTGSVAECRDLIDLAGHRLALQLPREPISVDGDPARLRQMLTNLLSNAVKFTPQGGTIEVSAQRDDTNVRLYVKDNGLGIPGDRLGAIFGSFEQLDLSLETGYKGLGLGLSLVKALAELHDGSVEAYSEGLGKGSRFTLLLPMAADVAVAEAAETPSKRTPAAVPRRVLLCEDNRDVARSLSRLVRIFGHEIRVAFDGKEALQIASEFNPEIVLLDIGLPGLNGYEVGRELRSRPGGSAIKLIAVTGWGSEKDKLRALEAGFDEHLTKPVDSQVLEASLRSGR